MRKLLKYLNEYKLRAVLAPLFKMLEAIFELLVPLVMVKLVDVGIKNHDNAYIFKCGGILLLLTFIGYAASITAQYFAARSAIGFGNALRKDVFKHINSFSFENIDGLGTSTLITRMTSDINITVTGVNMFLRLFLRSPFIVFGAVIMAFTVDSKTSMIFMFVLPLLMLVVFTLTFASIPMYKKVQNKLDKVTLLTREGLIGIRVIRAFNRQRVESREYRKANESLMDSQLAVGRVSTFMNPVTNLIVNLGIASLIYTGAVKVQAGDLTQGQIIALVNYMSQILVELVKLANLIITLTKAAASANRLRDLLETEPTQVYGEPIEEDPDAPVRKPRTSVVFDHVSMCYKGSQEAAIKDISFEAKAGQTIGIIGGTGSGKSTLVNLIPRFYDITDGSIKIDGLEIEKYTKDDLRKKISIVPQQSTLFKGTVEENLRVADKDAREYTLKWAIDTAQASEFVYKNPEGLKYMINQGGKNLSGGQRQRLCIARALVSRPEILILDDSSSALDFATEANLKKALEETGKDRITIIVSQRASSILDADHIIVLEDGEAVAQGTHSELFRTSEIYREIYHTQFKNEMGVKA